MIEAAQILLAMFLGKGEKGQDMAEYALLIGLMALGTIVAINIISGQLIVVLRAVADYLASVHIG
jgi:Flp pilus assembly pilin Flp